MTVGIDSPFYMREVERHFRRWGWYPDEFLTELVNCPSCDYHLIKKPDHTTNYKALPCSFCRYYEEKQWKARQRLYNKTKISVLKLPLDMIEMEMVMMNTEELLAGKTKINLLNKTNL